MLLDTLEISNVRSIETISFSLSEKVTVIVGKNGVGKSAILEAIALSLGQPPKRADPLRMDKDGNKTDHLTISIDLKKTRRRSSHIGSARSIFTYRVY